jgi:hypothetical protein
MSRGLQKILGGCLRGPDWTGIRSDAVANKGEMRHGGWLRRLTVNESVTNQRINCSAVPTDSFIRSPFVGREPSL